MNFPKEVLEIYFLGGEGGHRRRGWGMEGGGEFRLWRTLL
jgi:hypothetical protein